MVEGSGAFHHGHTYAGNPLSCGIASKVIDIIEREGWVDNAAQQGEYLMNQLQKLYDNPIVGDIRGKGLMLGVELVKDQTTKEPFDPSLKANALVTNICLDEGLVPYPGGGSVDGRRGDHLQITPPINITKDQVDELVDRLDKSLKRAKDQLLK